MTTRTDPRDATIAALAEALENVLDTPMTESERFQGRPLSERRVESKQQARLVLRDHGERIKAAREALRG